VRTRPATFLALSLALCACRQDMHDGPRFEPLEGTSFFADQRSARPQVPDTVARGELDLDDHLHRGQVGGELATTFPFPITREVLERGRERYDIFCAACHDRTGSGQGMVVLRGTKQPASFHVERLREAPPGYFFDVVTRGFGAMFDLSDRIAPRDRWAIVAYVRALQLSQAATLEDVPPGERATLEGTR
jgi:hypothetical protein